MGSLLVQTEGLNHPTEDSTTVVRTEYRRTVGGFGSSCEGNDMGCKPLHTSKCLMLQWLQVELSPPQRTVGLRQMTGQTLSRKRYGVRSTALCFPQQPRKAEMQTTTVTLLLPSYLIAVPPFHRERVNVCDPHKILRDLCAGHVKARIDPQQMTSPASFTGPQKRNGSLPHRLCLGDRNQSGNKIRPGELSGYFVLCITLRHYLVL